MTDSKQHHPAATATPAIKSSASETAQSRKPVGGELPDQDLDKVSGGPTAVERNHTPI
jgi:hypothetical protein